MFGRKTVLRKIFIVRNETYAIGCEGDGNFLNQVGIVVGAAVPGYCSL